MIHVSVQLYNYTHVAARVFDPVFQKKISLQHRHSSEICNMYLEMGLVLVGQLS